MRALVKTERQAGLVLTTLDIPEIGPLDVLVRVRATSICGTDLKVYGWNTWAQKEVHVPLVGGHELCGDVVDVGKDVTQIKVGDFISAESHIVDYDGEYFKHGLGHVAPETKIIGIHRDGAFAEYIALPWQNARKNPKDMPTRIAVLKENFGNAVHAGYAVELEGKDILMIGCGPPSLMTLLVARARGARMIIASEFMKFRREFAERLGVDHVVNPKAEELTEQVRDLTHGKGVDVVFEMSGDAKEFERGLRLLKRGGNMIAFGLAGQVDFNLTDDVIFQGITIHGIVGRKMWDTWEKEEQLLDDGKVDLSEIVTHEFGFEDFERAFELFKSGNSGKVILKP